MYYFNESLAIALVFGDTCNSNNNCMDDVENLAGNSKESTKSHTSDDNNPELTESSVCMECVKAIPVCSKEQIKPGDHITFPGYNFR
jgi:hypothetical protein